MARIAPRDPSQVHCGYFMRQLYATLAILLGAVAGDAALQPQVQTPPGESRVITPPIPQPKPTPADPVVPTPDPLAETFQIVATIGGIEVSDENVTLPVGHLLTLTLRGGDFDKQAVTWTVSRATTNLDNWPVDSDHLTFTAPPEESGVSFLFSASINGETKPSTAMRWVTIGVLPRPPPTPVPPGPVPPGPTPPVVEGKRSLVIVHESAADDADFARLLINLRDGSAADYLKSKGHAFSLLDPDDKDPDGTTSDLVEQWKPFLVGLKLPAVFVIDTATNKVLFKDSLAEDATADNIIELVKRNGG